MDVSQTAGQQHFTYSQSYNYTFILKHVYVLEFRPVKSRPESNSETMASFVIFSSHFTIKFYLRLIYHKNKQTKKSD